MNLTELKKLAEAAMSPAPYEREQGQADLKAVGIPQTILAMIALIEQMKDAIVTCNQFGTCKWINDEQYLVGYDGAMKLRAALAAYEEMNK